MGDLLAPGSEHGADLVDDDAVLAAMLAVEDAWLAALITTRIAPPSAAADLAGLIRDDDAARIAAQSESAGNPVVPLVALLRDRAAAVSPAAAVWIHRGLTSQDVLDTALILLARSVLDQLLVELRSQLTRLLDVAQQHTRSVMVARTLTQYAVPTTFGLKAATWLDGLRASADELLATRRSLVVQAGGAAGTRAAWHELARIADRRPTDVVSALAEEFSGRLNLAASPPWHTNRRVVTAMGDALVALTDAYGHVANDVLLMNRPEVGELSLSGGGGSSTMPHKQNPVLPILVRRAALAAPMLGAQLHLASAAGVDERPDGAWHLEWDALRSLLRSSTVAASQMTRLLGSLVVDVDRMRERVDSATDQVLSERDGIATALGVEPPVGRDPAGYLGAAEEILRTICDRAETTLKELR